MPTHNVFELLDKYLSGACSPEEIRQVEEWLQNQENKDNEWEKKTNSEKAAIIRTLFNNIQGRIGQKNKEDKNKGKLVNMRARLFIRFAAAVVIFFILGTAAYLYLLNRPGKGIATATQKKQTLKKDILPGGNKATLTLADGSKIVLDEAKNGDLTQQGNTKVVKLNGKLAYDPAKTGDGKIVYNTIATPRGGKYQIELPDGSQVWLNAASSLRFPTAFVGNVRKVEITGEAYFEVAKNKNMPFIVSVGDAAVQVLGTHFDIMAYKDEELVKTTLLEGSVKFINGNNISLLKPGQQSQLSKNGQVKVTTDVDVDNVISWKNGMFHFENTDIETVMRQLSRWYDVEVVFKSNKLYDPVKGEIPFNTNLSDALKILEQSGTAKFEIEGKRIMVIQ